MQWPFNKTLDSLYILATPAVHVGIMTLHNLVYIRGLHEAWFSISGFFMVALLCQYGDGR